jgi:hypothetical protein
MRAKLIAWGQFMEAMDNSQFPHSSTYLYSGHQAINNFINSIQEPNSVFRDDSPGEALSLPFWGTLLTPGQSPTWQTQTWATTHS